MKFLFPIFIFALLGTTPDHEVNFSRQIIGHWTSVSTGDSLFTVDDFIKSGKEITFQKITYSAKKYQWGGGCYNGIEFTAQNGFNFYNNTLCSTETSPATIANENWSIKENIITVTHGDLSFSIRIVSVDKKKLVVVFTKQP